MHSNPDIETLKLVLIISSAIIGILLTIIGYLSSTRFGKLDTTLEALSSTVSNLEKIVKVIEARQNGDGQFSKEKHDMINYRLTKHTDQIEKHNERILVIETKLDIK